MKKIDFGELLNRYYKMFLMLFMLFIVLLGVAVMIVRRLDLTTGGRSTWWMITKNIDDGKGYKSCDESYVPDRAITDQTTVIREPLPVLIYVLVEIMTNDSLFAFQISQLIFNILPVGSSSRWYKNLETAL